MRKKYAPYLLLALAALLLFFVKKQQRGGYDNERLEITTDAVRSNEPFSRSPEKIRYTKHARCRMECRHITEDEVNHILKTGRINTNKIENNEMGTTYPLDGKTTADKMVRIVVAPKRAELVVVTVIDLDTDWPCQCPH